MTITHACLVVSAERSFAFVGLGIWEIPYSLSTDEVPDHREVHSILDQEMHMVKDSECLPLLFHNMTLSDNLYQALFLVPLSNPFTEYRTALLTLASEIDPHPNPLPFRERGAETLPALPCGG